VGRIEHVLHDVNQARFSLGRNDLGKRAPIALPVGRVDAGIAIASLDEDEAVALFHGKPCNEALRHRTVVEGDRGAAPLRIEAPAMIGAFDLAIDDAPIRQRRVPVRASVMERDGSLRAVAEEDQRHATQEPPEWLAPKFPACRHGKPTVGIERLSSAHDVATLDEMGKEVSPRAAAPPAGATTTSSTMP